MEPFTVISDYFATGEGRTLSVWLGFAEDEEDALKQFKTSVYGGDYFSIGAEVKKGLLLDDPYVMVFLTDGVKNQLQDEKCNRCFASQLHYNYS